MEIPEIKVPDIYIPDVPKPYTPHYLQIAKPPDINVPGCAYQHRDIKNTGNHNLLIEDKNGVYTLCDFSFPGFIPLDYTPENLVITEQAPVYNEELPLPESKTPDAKLPEKKDEEIVIPDCPGKNDRRINEYTSELRTERVKGYKRGDDGIECIPIYESVTFVDSVLPSPSAALNVVAISLLAASSPLLLGVLKSLSKTIFKNIISKFNKNKVK